MIRLLDLLLEKLGPQPSGGFSSTKYVSRVWKKRYPSIGGYGRKR